MTPFLKELAEEITSREGRLDELTFVFPNRRASLYFQNYLSSNLSRPQWAPRLYSIEEYFKRISDLEEPDRLTLIFKLYKVYSEVLNTNEPFDRFYFWGEMLLRDFDELDKYMVNAVQLFKDLSKLKELDETFDYLSEEQKAFLQQFWSHFAERPSLTKEEFLRMWRKLPKVYSEYKKLLKKEGLGYEGMIQRDVADRLAGKDTAVPGGVKVIFAGFNALTKSEQAVISRLVDQGAEIFWDTDTYYLDNELQEAGQFLRQYRNDATLARTFSKRAPAHLAGRGKKISLTGVPRWIGQVKRAGKKIEEILNELPRENLALELSKTVIVLPDEAMLLPVMHSLPVDLEDINVTMGFPLRHTPMFNLLDQVIEMQVRQRNEAFSHREVTAILGHAYFLAIAGDLAHELLDSIVSMNRVFVKKDDLQGSNPVFGIIFRTVRPEHATAYLLEIIEHLGVSFSDKKSFDREYAFHFHQSVSRLHSILSGAENPPDWRGFQKLFRQVVISQRIPFLGEPLRGLQIMGLLETRNLDFDNVIFLSANEGLLPSTSRQGSYIPHAIRKAYSLPTVEHQDAIYAYLFYRLLQRAGHIDFYYNTETDVVGNGEMSRYLQQLLLESGLQIDRYVLHNPVQVHQARPIEIPKTATVLEQLAKYEVNPTTGDAAFKLTPSNLNDFIDCGLRFFLRHIARLSEANEVEEDVDARNFGNILHQVMGWFYDELRRKGNGRVSKEDLLDPSAQLERLIDRAFRKFYFLDESKPVVYEGQRVVVREMVHTFASKVIEMDVLHAPFEITMVEEPFAEFIELKSGRKIKIGGTIDRADRKDHQVRVIDYKTGKDDQNFDGVESLFVRDAGRTKAAFQTMLYAYVYHLRSRNSTEKIIPGLISRKNLFGKEFAFGLTKGRGTRSTMDDVGPYLEEFAARLNNTLEEMYDANTPFRQTSYLDHCKFCPYKGICRR